MRAGAAVAVVDAAAVAVAAAAADVVGSETRLGSATVTCRLRAADKPAGGGGGGANTSRVDPRRDIDHAGARGAD
jgi:hypothetical protein